MLEYAYRYRSARALLERFNELENLEIFFSRPEDLNDPMEGFKDVVWDGDEIVWANLLRHYLLCLLLSAGSFVLDPKNFTKEACANFVFQTEGDIPDPDMRQMYSDICGSFFDAAALELVKLLSSSKKKVRRERLTFYLRLLHSQAMTAVFSVLRARGLVPSDLTSFPDIPTQDLRNALKVLATEPTEPDFDKIFPYSELMIEQINLINASNKGATGVKKPWIFLLVEFPSYYVGQIERLMYPEWYTACFAANCTDASMWGSYADGHRGVCLKFKTSPNGLGLPSLSLYQPTGMGGSKAGITIHYGYVSHEFSEVRYGINFPEIDFFKSLGILPIPKLSGFWYLSENGQLSPIGQEVLREDEGWRKAHWATFAAGQTIKTTEWSHEQEYRLTLHSYIHNLTATEARKLKFRFADLDGIVFGIRTSEEDKLSILKIIEKHCRAEGRTDFNFYQIVYQPESKTFEAVPLGLIKLDR